MDDTTMQQLVGVLAPLVTAIVKQRNWPKEASVLLTLALCVAGSIAIAGKYDSQVVMQSWTIAIVAYYGAWKPTGIAPQIEQRTYLGNDQDIG